MIIYFLILLNIIFSIEFETPYMEEYQLSNGIKIVLAPTYEQPLVFVGVLVGAGKMNAGINKYFVAELTSDLLKPSSDKFFKSWISTPDHSWIFTHGNVAKSAMDRSSQIKSRPSN